MVEAIVWILTYLTSVVVGTSKTSPLDIIHKSRIVVVHVIVISGLVGLVISTLVSVQLTPRTIKILC